MNMETCVMVAGEIDICVKYDIIRNNILKSRKQTWRVRMMIIGRCGDMCDGCRENEKNMETCVTELGKAFANDDMVGTYYFYVFIQD